MFRSNDINFQYSPEGYNEGSVCVIDQYDAEDFNRNDAGWIRNDISQLVRAQTKQEYDLIMSRLSIQQNSENLAKGVSNEDAIKMIRPRWCQSPNELEQFAQYTQADVMAKLDEAYQKSVQKPVAKPAESSNTDNNE